MQNNGPKTDDPLKKLPSWKLICIGLTSLSALGAAIYLMAAILLSLPHWKVALAVFAICGAAVSVLMPKNGK